MGKDTENRNCWTNEKGDGMEEETNGGMAKKKQTVSGECIVVVEVTDSEKDWKKKVKEYWYGKKEKEVTCG